LPEVIRPDIVESENVIRVSVCQQNRIESLDLCAQRLLPEIRRRIDDDVLSAA